MKIRTLATATLFTFALGSAAPFSASAQTPPPTPPDSPRPAEPRPDYPPARPDNPSDPARPMDLPSDRDRVGTSGEQQARPAQAQANDAKSFVKKAMKDGQMELELAQLAQQKATNPQVKEFAAKLVTDHQKAAAELKSIAQQKNWNLPGPVGTSGEDASMTARDDREPAGRAGERPARTGEERGQHAEHGAVGTSGDNRSHKADAQRLRTLSGAEFDREFVNLMLKMHQKDIQEYQQAANTVNDNDVKSYAQKTLPTLKQHEQQAQQLKGTLGS